MHSTVVAVAAAAAAAVDKSKASYTGSTSLGVHKQIATHHGLHAW